MRTSFFEGLRLRLLAGLVLGCADLAERLRARQGRLVWRGSFVWPDILREPESFRAAISGVARAVLLGEPFRFSVLLPSEERVARRLEAGLREWIAAVSRWQLVVPGDPTWTPEQAGAWKAALDAWVGRRLWPVWVLAGLSRRSRDRLLIVWRTARFAIDSHIRVR